MSKFFVGQRVKKVRGVHNLGHEGVIVALGHFPQGPCAPGRYRPFDTDIKVMYSSAWENTDGEYQPASLCAFSLKEHFEPLYDGHQPVSWKSCRWQPSPQEANA